MSWPVILSGVVCVTTLALGSRRPQSLDYLVR
jgi:hypothetical protein